MTKRWNHTTSPDMSTQIYLVIWIKSEVHQFAQGEVGLMHTEANSLSFPRRRSVITPHPVITIINSVHPQTDALEILPCWKVASFFFFVFFFFWTMTRILQPWFWAGVTHMYKWPVWDPLELGKACSNPLLKASFVTRNRIHRSNLQIVARRRCLIGGGWLR